jgi:hypothetical protein
MFVCSFVGLHVRLSIVTRVLKAMEWSDTCVLSVSIYLKSEARRVFSLLTVFDH